MTPRAWLLIAWIVVGGALAMTYVHNLAGGLRASEVPWRWRWLALVPPLAPLFSWLGGFRNRVWLFVFVASVYAALRMLEGVV